MGNRWIDCNYRLCAEYKSIWYQLGHYCKGDAMLTKIEKEFSESRCSETLNDWLENNSASLKIFVMDSKHDKTHRHERERTASTPILTWAEILKSYLQFKHDTPSAKQLWKWAEFGYLEQQATIETLKHLNISVNGKSKEKVMSFANSYSTTYEAYRQLFRRHINTESIEPEAKRRKHEKWYTALHKRIMKK
jgi:hypothetical protein